MAQVNISIPDDMKVWLDDNPQINRSDLFRQAVNQKKNFMKGKVSSTVFFTTTVGILMSVSLILISLIPIMNTMIRASIALIGGILAFLIALTYYMERKDINARKNA